MGIDDNSEFKEALNQVRHDIERGVYLANEKIQPLYEFAKIYQVSQEMMRSIIDQLVEERLVTRRLGVGVFVNPKPIYSSGIEELGSVSEMIKKAGKVPGTQFVAAEIVEPTKSDFNNFNYADLRLIARVERVRTADGEPVVYCIDKVDNEIVPIGHIHQQDSIFNLIHSYTGKTIEYAHAYVEPIGYHDTISAILNCGPDQSLLLLRQMHYTKDDEPILYSENYFRSDAFQFHVVRKRM